MSTGKKAISRTYVLNDFEILIQVRGSLTLKYHTQKPNLRYRYTGTGDDTVQYRHLSRPSPSKLIFTRTVIKCDIPVSGLKHHRPTSYYSK
jgi:hypothetical protein